MQRVKGWRGEHSSEHRSLVEEVMVGAADGVEAVSEAGVAFFRQYKNAMGGGDDD